MLDIRYNPDMPFDRVTKLIIGTLLLIGGGLCFAVMAIWHPFGASVGGSSADALLAAALVVSMILGLLLVRANWRPRGGQ